jgi:D-alanyl-D-alanine carboxypeptidase
MTRIRLVSTVMAALVIIAVLPAEAGAAETPRATPEWIQQVDEIAGDLPVSIAIGNDGETWYTNLPYVRRPPASNEKLLLSMALFDRFDPEQRIRLSAMSAAKVTDEGVLRGDLWLVGHGDPETDAGDLKILARALIEAGVSRVRGDVMGSLGPFARDWWATGWKSYFPTYYVAFPTALTYNHNEDSAGHHVSDPERRAAIAFVNRLELLGVPVKGAAGAGRPPAGMQTLAETRSAPLRWIMRRMNVKSHNFWAEVLGKYLGARAYGKGTIANGAAAIEDFAAAHHVDLTCYDSSGLSYSNRAYAAGTLKLLWYVNRQSWADLFRGTLPRPGEGTLKERLLTVDVRAKTGTLDSVSALSGWVRLQRSGEWAEFSIMSSGYSQHYAKKIENQIVKVVARSATDPTPET